MNLINKFLMIVALLSLTFATTTNAQNEKPTKGIQFEQGSWAEVQALAKETGKPIFVDAYASWCGPCKKMAKEVFPLKSVGDFMNENYINYKLDMEKGDGIAFSRRNNVKSYPTYLFFSDDGDLTHRTLGYKEGEDFLVDASNALDPDKSLVSLATRYKVGERDKSFLMNYATALMNANMPYTKVAEQYIELLDETELQDKNAQNFVYATANDINSKQFKILMDNRSLFNNTFGADKVDQKIQRCALMSVAKAADTKDEDMMSDIKKILKKNGGDNSKTLISMAHMNYNKGIGNWAQYAKYASKYIDSMDGESASVYNNIAWSFYEQEEIDDPKLIAKAVKWAKRSVDLDCQYYNCDTYAAILYKAKDYATAKMAAEKAIEQAKASGDAYGETQILLDMINEKL